MTKLAHSLFLAVIFSLALSSSSAQTLSGTVTNGTTNKPAAGDEVILINLTTSMEIADRTKADASGKFSFILKDSGNGGPHLIRAVHQGVTYHQIAPPGTASVAVNVYDVAQKVSGLSVTADVIRFQADATTLQGVRLFVVDNNSSPAHTQMNDHNFEFYLPAGAKVEQVQARAPNGQPIAAEAVPQPEKNRYAINFPLRPGETQFQLEFTMPYSGEIKIDPKPVYPAEHFVVVAAPSMQFAAANPPSYERVKDPTQGNSTVQVAKEVKPGQPLNFTLKGTGTIAESSGDATAGDASGSAPGAGMQAQQAETPPGQRDNRPGGGLGVPIDAPDALQKYRWPILGTFAVLLAIGAWLSTKRTPSVAASASSSNTSALGTNAEAQLAVKSPGMGNNNVPPTVATTTTASTPKPTMLLEALKEELFQLEVERKQGKLSTEEYDRAKAALDQTLDRALKRQS